MCGLCNCTPLLKGPGRGGGGRRNWGGGVWGGGGGGGEIPQGEFDGLEFSEWEFSMRNFPKTLKHVRLLKNLIREIFLSLGTAMKIMPFCLHCVIHAICFFPYIKKMTLLILLSSAVFSRFVI